MSIRKAHAGRAVALSIASVAAIALTGCGPATNSADYKDAFEKGFNASFDKTMHDSCVTSATGSGAAADVAERYCSCVVTELDKLPIDQREKLNASSPELATAASTCKAQAQS